jgi:UDP:flavonoid glycosyltransferase YjiC (YdhE family)
VSAIAFTSGGGDFHPLVAAALGLRARGHDVELFCDPEGARVVEGSGLRTFVDRDVWAAIALAQDEFSSQLRVMPVEDWGRLLPEWMARRGEMLAPAFIGRVREHRTDLVIAAMLATSVARDTHRATGAAWCIVNTTYNIARAPETPVDRWIASIMREAPLVLHATDALFDEATSVPGREYVGPLTWEPDEPVPPYLLEDGPPWALVTVSMIPQGDIALVSPALASIHALGLRAVATIGNRNDPASVGAVPPNARLERSVSHAAVLERAALLVGHAGHGSVSKAMWHGVPMVLVPWGRDQPGVARRAERLGIARVVSRDDLGSLPNAIKEVLTQDRYRSQAAWHAARLRTSDPRTLACDLIEARFRGDTRPMHSHPGRIG